MLGDGHGMPNRRADGRPLAAADVERVTLVRQSLVALSAQTTTTGMLDNGPDMPTGGAVV
jgi:hypothetical protein